jgi:hypothetical protein
MERIMYDLLLLLYSVPFSKEIAPLLCHNWKAVVIYFFSQKSNRKLLHTIDRAVQAEALLATSRQLSRQRAHAEQHLKE